MDSSSEDQRAFVAFIAARAYRSDGQNQDDLDRRKRYRLALVISLIVHGLLYLGIREWSLLHHKDTADVVAIQLRLIDASAPVPPPDVAPIASPSHDFISNGAQKPPVAALPRLARVVPVEAVVATPLPERVADVPPLAREHDVALSTIFRSDGRVVLPAVAADDPAEFGSRKHAPDYRPNPMAHQSPLPYKATPFDRYWKPDGETLLGEWVRKASKEASHDTKYGTRITCKAFLFLMACGWGPTPRVSIEELKAMRADPPAPRHTADDPWIAPIP